MPKYDVRPELDVRRYSECKKVEIACGEAIDKVMWRSLNVPMVDLWVKRAE